MHIKNTLGWSMYFSFTTPVTLQCKDTRVAKSAVHLSNLVGLTVQSPLSPETNTWLLPVFRLEQIPDGPPKSSPTHLQKRNT